jgi:hypothetical protein
LDNGPLARIEDEQSQTFSLKEQLAERFLEDKGSSVMVQPSAINADLTTS